MSKNIYIYPAIFEYADDGISISFPDLPGCFSCAETDEEALRMAKDALGLMLYTLEIETKSLPTPSPLKDIATAPNQKAVLVEVFMPLVRRAIDTASIKKTLTIPAWLNRLAEEQHINFSQTLQEALKQELGIAS